MINFLKDVLGDRIDLHGGLQDFMRRKFGKEIKGTFRKSMVTFIHTFVCTQHYMYIKEVCVCVCV